MTDRIPLDHLTSDQYDELCDDLDRYEEVQGEMNERAIDLERRAARAEATLARVRAYAQNAIAAGDTGPGANLGRLLLDLLDEPAPATATQATDDQEQPRA